MNQNVSGPGDIPPGYIRIFFSSSSCFRWTNSKSLIFSSLHEEINIAGLLYFPPDAGAENPRPFNPVTVQDRQDYFFDLLYLVHRYFLNIVEVILVWPG
jgi:hypothetical protein